MKTINKDVLCMMPWLHMHIWPNGNSLPCCMSDSNVVFGNVNDNSIDEIINNDKFKTLRKEMLNGIKPSVCSRCYELEETADVHTLRKNSLMQFEKYIPLVNLTDSDGTIEDFKLRYMDIRFSNLCNMKCRTCGPELSSKWYEDQIKMYPEYDKPKFIDLSSREDFMDMLKPHLHFVDEVYFAGGEALITPQHYEVLDYWKKINRTDVRLRYTTNFSVLKYKKFDILNYWKTFSDVRVAASLDNFGSKAEYFRSGTKWDNIVSNRRKMIKECPDVYFEITPTVSIFNIQDLFDFHRTWVNEGLLDINSIRINILTNPRYFSITLLPTEFKEKISKQYTNYILWLKQNRAEERIINDVKGIIDHMNSYDNSSLLPAFISNIEKIDKVRSEKFIDLYTEYTTLWNQQT